MYLFIYTVLLASGGALAHFKDYASRNLFVRDEPIFEYEGKQLVNCPVCNKTEWSHLFDTCDTYVEAKSYKHCKYGTYRNRVCGYRLDCKRGPGDRCSTYDNQDMLHIRCADGYHCDELEHKCVGGNSIANPIDKYYRNPLSYSGTDKSRATDLFNTRERRSAPYHFLAPH